MSAYSQDNRILAITTPLGKDVLLLEGFQGNEGISRLFNYKLTLVSEKPGIAFDAIVGQNVTMSVLLPSGAKRFFNGIVSRFVQNSGGSKVIEPRFSSYRATVVPWFWLLTRTADSRIFQKMTVPEIVEQIFREQGFADFNLKLQGSYDKRDYCVQYRETDFNFISRLLEEEGIHYFFEHTEDTHTLILADSPSTNKPCPNQETARFKINIGGKHDDDVIYSFDKSQEIRPGKYTLNDFNFETPNTGLTVESPSRYKLGPGEREIYDYPGRYGAKAEGDRYAGIRMEEEEARITTIVGTSECRAFVSGYRFTLASFYRRDMNSKEYLLTSIRHKAHQGWANDAILEYANRFTCIPADVPYRPSRFTPKPVVRGAQTAIVVGPSGEEIYVDEHGRVKVQFHWDREGKKNEESSCWVRVSQLWAGAGWGAMFIPRIGQEVIVDFLEGDPDRPIITGRVYHAVNKPPYPLPAEMTKSTIKSNSSKGGGGFNEFRFEDKKGSEEIFLHGQKDWNITILNNESESVGNDMSQSVGHDRTQTVGHNKTNTVKNDFTETITKNATITIAEGNLSHDVKVGTATYHVQSDLVETYDAKQTTTVKADIAITSTGGPITVSSDSQNIHISAATSITLEVGASKIMMDSAGHISIKGVDIVIDGSASVTTKGTMITSEAKAQNQTTGAIVLSDGSATNTVKGGMVMLNP